MGISPFFIFLRSPVYIVSPLLACLLLPYVSWIADKDQFFVFLVFLLFFFIGFWGYAIGGIIAENQHRMLTWTLPHFRKRLMLWSIIVGLFSVVVWTIMLPSAPLNASWSTILLMNLGCYCFGFVCPAGWDFGVTRSKLIRAYPILIFFFLLVLAFWGEEVLAWGEQNKLWLAFIAFAIAIGAFYLMFNQTTFRKKPFSLIRSLRSTFYLHTWEMWKKDAIMMRKTSTRIWHLEHIGTSIFNWLQAGQYGNSGRIRWGWLLPAFSAALVMVFFFFSMETSFFGLLGRSPYDFETVLKTIYHMIFYFHQLDPKVVINISVTAFLGVWICILNSSSFLKRGYVYPLSRTQRMWIQYCGFLVQNISFLVASVIVLGVLGILAGSKIGFVSEGDISLRILCVFGWAVVLWPIFQWLQIKYHLYEFKRTQRQIWGTAFVFLIMILAFGFAGFVGVMRNLYPDLALTYEAPILLVCFILLQWFLLSRLKRYYATQDLV